MGLPFVRFLAACYLTFNMDFGTVDQALGSLPPLPPTFRRSGSARSAGGMCPQPVTAYMPLSSSRES